MVLNGNAAKNLSGMAIPLSEIAAHLETAFDVLIDRNFNFFTNSLPLCLFKPKYWKYFRNSRYQYTASNILSSAGPDGYMIRSCGQQLAARCVDCQLKKYCPGTWGTYYAYFGDKEFHPQELTAEKSLLLGAADILLPLQTPASGARKSDFKG